jgi:hypothetical protein
MDDVKAFLPSTLSQWRASDHHAYSCISANQHRIAQASHQPLQPRTSSVHGLNAQNGSCSANSPLIVQDSSPVAASSESIARQPFVTADPRLSKTVREPVPPGPPPTSSPFRFLPSSATPYLDLASFSHDDKHSWLPESYVRSATPKVPNPSEVGNGPSDDVLGVISSPPSEAKFQNEAGSSIIASLKL